MKVRVLHSYYGCETGCCGHIIETEDGTQLGHFTFDHPSSYRKETHQEFAKRFLIEEFGPEHCYDLDWENCEVVED